MGADARDLRFQKRDPRVQFVQRIPFQVFTGEEAGGSEVALG